jgi:hypothetical protein
LSYIFFQDLDQKKEEEEEEEEEGGYSHRCSPRRHQHL